MAKLAVGEHGKHSLLGAEATYVALVVGWIKAICVVALDVAADAGGNVFLPACFLATAGIFAVFSVREFLCAYSRLRRSRE